MEKFLSYLPRLVALDSCRRHSIVLAASLMKILLLSKNCTIYQSPQKYGMRQADLA